MVLGHSPSQTHVCVCVDAGQYEYTWQLQQLDRPPEAGSRLSSGWGGTVSRPLQWKRELEGHPDRWFAEYISRGFERGFRVGFQGAQAQLRTCGRNMVSVRDHPEVVEKYLVDEAAAGRLLAVGSKEMVGVHCSPFGVIPKKGRENKWRLIVDLSAPEGGSINDGISKEMSSLSYLSVDQVVARVVSLGPGTLLAKLDICQAYRNVPVHPQDRPLLGVEWKGTVYVDSALPFGLRSAPLLFTAVGGAFQWIMLRRGVSWLGHYVDDFITMGAAGRSECESNLFMMAQVCHEMGLPVEPSKTEGPATVIMFLGMELDARTLEIRLPPEKLERLQASLVAWRTRRHGEKRDLLSLIGLLAHACKAIRAGRSFLRWLIDLSATVKVLNRHIRLNQEARSDIQWWWQFCANWNGVAMMQSRDRGPPSGSAEMWSDASGSWGVEPCVVKSGFRSSGRGWGSLSGTGSPPRSCSQSW